MLNIPGVNEHTEVFVEAIQKNAKNFSELKISDIAFNPPNGELEIKWNKFLEMDIAHKDHVPGALKWGQRLATKIGHDLLVFSDPNARWDNEDHARQALFDLFPGMLKCSVCWTEPDSDRTLVRLVTQGIGAHLLERNSDGGFTVDLRWMERHAVRRPFHCYGGLMHLTSDLEIINIKIGKKTYWPNRPDWHIAKLIMRASIAAEVTIVRHAVHCHFIVNNCCVIATRRSLHPRHALRRLLIPFQYRGPTINGDATLLLIPKNGIFHRLFGFTWSGLKGVYRHARDTFVQETFRENLVRRGVLGHPGYPYGEDGLRLWDSIRRFVKRYFEAVGYGGHIPLQNYKTIMVWLKDLQSISPAKIRISDWEDLIDFLTHQLFNSTGWHEHVGGTIGDYLMDYRLVGIALRDKPNYAGMLPSKQTMLQAYMLGVLTSYAMPRLLDNWWIFALGKDAKAAARCWQDELQSVAHEIDLRNLNRAQPYHIFNPKYLELSVSI